MRVVPSGEAATPDDEGRPDLSFYLRWWEIIDGSGGSLIAMRKALLPDELLGKGLSNVRCGNSKTELVRCLYEESQLEALVRRTGPLAGKS
ncbi:hypothetical protein FDA94_06040 [Herbidospora galbida]|uniref:Uncharacterized protein n=1 Tax=Herbidospora galbida TaxID=2575442 RepID=A0A4U3MNU1_9ACTN|nr:hypothetical protein [Herbidospora galbida]TKK90549.1 hypothetical protein FDA94_06040 [Herbidospora galbida]